MSDPQDPHRGQPILRDGPEPSAARLVVILIHGRGASASDILGLARELRTTDVAYIAPEAAGSTWYPYSFFAPIATNEPGLSSALGVIDGLVAECLSRQIAADRIGLLGFSQGACLTLEYAARHPRRCAGVMGWLG